MAGDTKGEECSAQTGENTAFILKITYTQKTMYLSWKGEAEGINQIRKMMLSFLSLVMFGFVTKREFRTN